MSKKVPPLPAPAELVAKEEPPKAKRGRPKTSPFDRPTQKKLSVQRYRQAKRESRQVMVEIFLPQEWRDWLVEVRGANLRQVGVEAFKLWMERDGCPLESLPVAPPAPDA